MKASAVGVQSESELKGKPIPAPGKYHVMLTHVNDSRVKKDGSALNATIVEMEVLAGTVPGQEGKVATQFFNLGENGEETKEYCEKVSRLCMAAGVLKPGEEKDVQAEDLENCQVVISFEAYTSKAGKPGHGISNYGLDIWGVNNPDVADVPKNGEAIRIWVENGGTPGGGMASAGGNVAATKAATTTPTTTAGTISTDDI